MRRPRGFSRLSTGDQTRQSGNDFSWFLRMAFARNLRLSAVPRQRPDEKIIAIVPHAMRGLCKVHIDSPEANRVMTTQVPDPLAHARYYYDNPPLFALAVDEPWWWAVLALGADYINVHWACSYRGPLAIVSRGQAPWHRNRDIQAIEAILRGDGRPRFDAYSCPRAETKIVGLVDVVDCVEDPPEPTSWFVGPHGLRVQRQCLLPTGHAGTLVPGQGLIGLSTEKRDIILYALTAMANRNLQPGVQRR